MKIAYFDCFSGASGDMILGALLDCDPSLEPRLRSSLAGLGVAGYDLKVAKVKREGIAATDVDVVLHKADRGHGRHLSDIAALIGAAALTERVKSRALGVFTRLADAEARIHGTSPEQIHFHEVGAVDAIVDIVGSCVLLDLLAIDEVRVSTIPCGHGEIVCQHGIMPIPAPATLELLKGFPVRSVDIEGELVTPTGAAIITTLAAADESGRMPDMRVSGSGFGAGKKQFKPDMPNLLRVVIGIRDAQASVDGTPETISVLETNLDDVSPEAFEMLLTRAFAAGALDVFFTPIQMKKNRPAHLATVLCPTDRAEALADVLFRETGTFGVRVRRQDRYVLDRAWETVATEYGEIRLKIGSRRGEILVVAPEYEDCKAAAESHSVPLRAAYLAAQAAGLRRRG
jgi:hypothetical protein